jgi:hypothetical protein
MIRVGTACHGAGRARRPVGSRVASLASLCSSCWREICFFFYPQNILWGGRFNVAGQFSDSSFGKFVLANFSASTGASRVVSVQTALRVTSFKFPTNGTEDFLTIAKTWVEPITSAVTATVPDYAQYSFM